MWGARPSSAWRPGASEGILGKRYSPLSVTAYPRLLESAIRAQAGDGIWRYSTGNIHIANMDPHFPGAEREQAWAGLCDIGSITLLPWQTKVPLPPARQKIGRDDVACLRRSAGMF